MPAVEQYGFQRRAAFGFGQLAVEDEPDRQIHVGGLVHVQVIHAAATDDHGDPGDVPAGLHQARAAARDQHVDAIIAAHQVSQSGPIQVVEHLYQAGGQSGR